MAKSKKPFFGRTAEQQALRELLRKPTASLVVCRGRRRIGKSRLIQEFASGAEVFWQFQGLPPRKGLAPKDQLDAFGEQLSRQSGLPKLGIDSWDKAFALLANQVQQKRMVILLDEISWMADGCADFAGKFKIAWDMFFSTYPSCVLVLCGSVSSWIDENILNNTGFVGRVSLSLFIEQLPLFWCNEFWAEKKERVSSLEKLHYIAVTGGVPRYLEELQPEKSSENNIRRLCFSPEGLLFNEFNQIFNEIFSRKARTYRDLVTVLAEGPKSLQKISDALKKERSGHLSACLEDLALSGFIKKHPSPPIGRSGATKIHEYRIIDNYLRFFLKYIAPIEGNIREGLYSNADIATIVPWDSIMGIQFETLVLNNIKPVLTLFEIEPGSVIRAAPYFQRKTNRTKPCQIDLLIETRHTLYICEIKCRDTIGPEVIKETDDKIQRLHVPEKMSVRPCLIHEGTVSPQVRNDGYFDRILSFSEMLKTRPAGE